MKKLVAIVLFSIFALSASAQVAFGIKAGFVTSLGFEEDWSAINIENLKMKTDQSYGFDVGLMLRAGYRFYAQVEANYHFVSSLASIGQDIDNVWDENYQPQQITQHSIHIPVLAGVKLVETENFNLRLMVGPTFNFNLNEEGAIVSETVDAEPRICAVGLDCGIGMDVWVFSIDARYRLVQPSYEYSYENVELNSSPINSFEVSLGWKFFDKTNKKKR
jgi:hypothetical protein